MSNAENENVVQEPKWPARVVTVLGENRIVINRGTDDGVRRDQRFLLYDLSEEELLDPVTEESLGRLEIPKGTGKVVHAQDRMATIQSDRENMRLAGLKILEPFVSPEPGDLIKPV